MTRRMSFGPHAARCTLHSQAETVTFHEQSPIKIELVWKAVGAAAAAAAAATMLRPVGQAAKQAGL